jgi:hypothetical protein
VQVVIITASSISRLNILLALFMALANYRLYTDVFWRLALAAVGIGTVPVFSAIFSYLEVGRDAL